MLFQQNKGAFNLAKTKVVEVFCLFKKHVCCWLFVSDVFQHKVGGVGYFVGSSVFFVVSIYFLICLSCFWEVCSFVSPVSFMYRCLGYSFFSLLNCLSHPDC